MSSICAFYLRGTCRFGDRCWNSHDLGTARSDSPFFQSETTDDEIHNRSASPVPSVSSPVSNTSRRNQKNQTSAIVAQISQKNTNTNKSKWILKNIDSGEEREGTPDSTLIEVVKKLNEAENLAISLTQQLHSRNEGGENFSLVEHQMGQFIDSDLQCNICYEIFIKPTVLNCSHTFCQECIDSWTRRVNHCPTCRVYVKNKSYCLTLDTFLDKILEYLPGDVKIRRESLRAERGSRVETSRNRRNNVRRRNNRQQSMRQRLDVLWGERDRDGVDWNIALEDALFDPIRLGDVLGRNRNDRDLWEEELSDSSLDRFYFLG